MPEKDTVHVESLGGIGQADIEFTPGITVLSGPNATNRSSFINALSAALGGSRAIPQSGSEEGRVRLDLNGAEYTRRVATTDDGHVRMDGSPLVADPDLVDLYVALDADNPIRKAVEQAASTEEVSESLREMLMTPVDDEALRAELQQLQTRRQAVVSELEEIQEQKEQLAALEQERTELRQELADVEAGLAAKREEMGSMEVGKKQSEEAEALLEELEDTERAEQRLEDDLERAEQSLEVAREERHELEDEVDQLASEVEDETDTSGERLDDLREEKNRLQDKVGVLMQVIKTSRELLEETGPIPDELRTADREGDDVLDELAGGDSHVECWACGTSVTENMLESRLEDLLDLVSSYRTDIRNLEEQITTVREQADKWARRKERLEDLQSRLADKRETVERYEQRVDEYREDLADQREKVSALREQVEATEDLRNHEILDLHDDLRSLSRQQGRLERELESVESDIDTLESRVSEEPRLKEERERLDENIESLHGRIERLEERAATTLQTHLDNLIDRLDYDSIVRVRVDRVTSDDGSQTRFEIAVVREDDDGVREDPHGLRSLSESERSLVGLLIAFAGYQTHGIQEDVPMILLDSIEEFDASRITQLIEYIADEVEYVVCALLPEDASGLPHATVDAEQLASRSLG